MKTLRRIALGTSWKTTAMGYVAAALTAMSSYVQNGTIDLKDPKLWAAVAFAVWGRIQKDGDVTGGTTPNAVNDPTVVVATARSTNDPGAK